MDYRVCRDVNSEFLWNSEKELEEFGSEIDYYLSDNLSEDKSFIEEALIQGRVSRKSIYRRWNGRERDYLFWIKNNK